MAEDSNATTATAGESSSGAIPILGPEPEPVEEPAFKDKEDWSARTSFTADSPYFTSFCESDVRSLQILGDTLKDISARTKTFCKTGALMSEATRRLALSCRLRPERDNELEGFDNNPDIREEAHRLRKKAVGEEMAALFDLLGSVSAMLCFALLSFRVVSLLRDFDLSTSYRSRLTNGFFPSRSFSRQLLDETAAAQLALCHSVESTLGMSLEAFAEAELQTVSMLKQEAEESTDSAEQVYARYLNSKQAPVVELSTSNESTAKPNSAKHLFKSVRKNFAAELDRRRRQESNTSEADATLGRAMDAAQLRTGLEQIRLSQATAELKRFQLMKHLISIKHRRNFELGENAMAVVHVMSDFHRRCTEKVQTVTPQLKDIQFTQQGLREQHANSIVPTWHAREVALTQLLDRIKEKAAHSIAVAEAVADGDPKLLDQQILKTEELEESVELWNLGDALAEQAQYQRESMPGVLLEGWLYKKSSAMISLQPWSRRWFVMDKDAVFFFRNENDARRPAGGVPYSERVKVCDVVLCTVRELPSENARFCFQLVTPSEKPLTLQARGPTEYRTWVDGIRAAIENRLVHGDPHSDQLNKNIGVKRRGSLTTDDSGSVVSGFSEKPPTEFGTRTASDRTADTGGSPSVKNPLVQQIMQANPFCADCGRENPDWASLNLGVLVCIECSGIHRSLGVHVSKVRSLTLDSLSDGEARVLLALGNGKANSIWEAGLEQQKGWKKPDPSADRKTREEWIKSKFAWRGFVSYKDYEGMTEEERARKFSRDLFLAAKECNIPAAADALAHGGSVEWKNPEEGGKTALHICALAKRSDDGQWKAIEMAEFLFQNGAKMDANAIDFAAHSVLDCALLGNAEIEMIEYLTSKRT